MTKKDKAVHGTHEWAASTVNCVTGCSHACRYCVGLETPIMIRDGSMKPIKDVKVGDKIVGVRKGNSGFNKFVETEVLNHWFVEKRAYKVKLHNGVSVICSADHRWLTKERGWKYVLNTPSGEIDRAHLTLNSIIFGIPVEMTPTTTDLYKKGYLTGVILGDALHKKFTRNRGRGIEYNYQFRLAAKDEEMVIRSKDYLGCFGVDVAEFMFPMVSNRKGFLTISEHLSIRTFKKFNFYKIKKLTSLNRSSPEFCRGFLAGMYDAEGSNTSAIRIFNSNERIISKIIESLKLFDFDFRVENQTNCKAIRLVGGLMEETRFIQLTNPAILRKRQVCFLNKFVSGQDDEFRVQSIKDVGIKQLCDITTGTENFIANGLVSHNCWAKAYSIRDGKKSVDTWEKETVDMKAVVKKYGKRNGTVMFPANHDITPNTLPHCVEVLGTLLKAGNRVLVVSKPHVECISKICDKFQEYKSQILFRFTIGSASDKVLSYWEPNAPPYLERIASLVFAYKSGFETSISCEPMLDDKIHRVVIHTEPYVTDAIWLGKANDLINRLTVNGADSLTLAMGRELIKMQSDEKILRLYDRFKNNPKVKWKDSIKKVVGLKRPTEKGLDI